MSITCPWCSEALEQQFVRRLTLKAAHCPACDRLVRKSAPQLLTSLAMLLPLIAAIIYCAKFVYDTGIVYGGVFVLFIGVVIVGWAQKFLPVFQSPARSFPRPER